MEVLKKVSSNGRAGNLSHRAFLLSGAYGSGKTSLARVFAAALNCMADGAAGVPCATCRTCRTIRDGRQLSCYVEVDGAAFGTIDQMREISRTAQFIPSDGRYVIIVLDEAHQLSSEAFNSCLKLIEDPPPHAAFVFVTTRRDRIPDTIRSRCLDVRFSKVRPKEITERVLALAKKHELDLIEKHAEVIVETADGVVRDAVVLLEQLAILSDGKITDDFMQQHLRLLRFPTRELIEAVCLGAPHRVHELTAVISEVETDVMPFIKRLVSFVTTYWRSAANLCDPLPEFDGLVLGQMWCFRFLTHMFKLARRIQGGKFAVEDFRLTLFLLAQQEAVRGRNRRGN